jgi:hypothetical protein
MMINVRGAPTRPDFFRPVNYPSVTLKDRPVIAYRSPPNHVRRSAGAQVGAACQQSPED